MSANDTLGGLTARDYSLIIVLLSIAFVLVTVGIGMAMAIANPTTDVVFSGSFNLDEYQAAILLLVGAGVTMVTQQLTTKQNLAAKKV